MPSGIDFFIPVLAYIVAYGALDWMQRRPPRWLPVDVPNARSLHHSPVPRAGGLAIMAGVLAAALVYWQTAWYWLLPMLGLAVVSFIDDVRGLSAAVRLLFHFLAVTFFLLLLPISIHPLALVLLVPATVWMMNLYNFMDGSDGLAGGMALFGFGVYGLVGWLAGDASHASINWAIAATALAFLRFNFHPARIFMGDGGSIPFGFLAAAMGILGWQRGLWSAVLPFLVFSPFIVDATLTLIRRSFRGERIWQAHRSHYYQRMVQMGWGHRKLALAAYGLMALVGVSALLAEWLGQWVGVLLAWMAIYLGLSIAIDRAWKRREGRTI